MSIIEKKEITLKRHNETYSVGFLSTPLNVVESEHLSHLNGQ